MAQCSDGIDNDGDGKIDYDDPECVGPLDNDESSFATGIPGDNMDACKQDCFFDGNSGAGDDDCDWQLKCDPRSTNAKCPYDQQYATSARERVLAVELAVAACINFCRKLVPNGCDCFGCCAGPGRADADQAGVDLHGGRLRQPGQVPALHAGHPVLQSVRALRDLHRQADDPGRLHARRRRRDRRPAPARLRQRLPGLRPGDRPSPPTGARRHRLRDRAAASRIIP